MEQETVSVSRPLSAEQLAKEFSERKFVLPVLGPKIPLSKEADAVPAESSDNEKDGNDSGVNVPGARLLSMLDPLSDRRISVRSQVSEAIWNPLLGLARLVKPQGKHFETMGHIYQGALHLHPEEALFLMEANLLMLTTCDKRVLSIQSAFRQLLSKSSQNQRQPLGLSRYRVYSHLMRLGFKLVRHKKTSSRNKEPPKNGRNTNHANPVTDDTSPEDVIVLDGVKADACSLASEKSRRDLSVREKIAALKKNLDNPGPTWLADIIHNEIDNLTEKLRGEGVPSESEDIIEVLDGGDRQPTKKRTYQSQQVDSPTPQKRSRKVDQVHLTEEVEVVEIEKPARLPISRSDFPSSFKHGFGKRIPFKNSGCFSSSSNVLNVTDKDDDIEVIHTDISERERILKSLPNCYKRTTMTFETPPTELLPFRAWPKEKSYLVQIRRPSDREKNAPRSDMGQRKNPFNGSRKNLPAVTSGNNAKRSNGNSNPSGLESRGFYAPTEYTLMSQGLVRLRHSSTRGKKTTPKFKNRPWKLYTSFGRWKPQGNGNNKGQPKKRINPETQFEMDHSGCQVIRDSLQPEEELVDLISEDELELEKDTIKAGGNVNRADKTKTTESVGVPHSSDKCRIAKDNSEDVVEVIGEKEAEIVEELPLTEGPLASLWTGKTVPLLQPKDAAFTSRILERISFTSDTSAESRVLEIEPILCQDFDIYAPHVIFRKSAPCQPTHRICVMTSKDPIPSQVQIQEMHKGLDDKVPLLFAVDSQGSLAFYCFSQIGLPIEISLG